MSMVRLYYIYRNKGVTDMTYEYTAWERGYQDRHEYRNYLNPFDVSRHPDEHQDYLAGYEAADSQIRDY